MQERTKSYNVVGPPGTGKTTYIKRQVTRAVEQFGEGGGDRSPVLVASLTRAAAAEASGRNLPLPAAAIGTLHAHAYRAMGCPPIVESAHIEAWNDDQPGAYAIDPDTFSKRGKHADGGNDNDADAGRGRYADRWPGSVLLQAHDLARHQMISPDSDTVEQFALEWNQWKTDMELIDFADMIESAPPVPPMSPRIVFVDEAQDLSALEWSLVRSWTTYAGRMLVAVGDPWQALYEWRGADPDRLLDPDVPRTVLHQSYRVPHRIHRRAVEWVRQLSNYTPIEYLPRGGVDSDGSVENCRSTIRTPDQAIDIAQQKAQEGHTVMLITTCGYMLNPLIAELRSRGVPFANPWRRHDGRWNPLRSGPTSAIGRLQALCGPPSKRLPWTWGDMDKFMPLIRSEGTLQRGAKQQIKEKADLTGWNRKAAHPEELSGIFDRVVFDRITYAAQTGSTSEMLEWLETVMLDKKRSTMAYPLRVAKENGLIDPIEPKIFVGTIHSFKGGEADTVILFPDLSPSATACWCDRGYPLADPIVRAFYVAMTRAKRSMYLCSPSDMPRHGQVDW